MATTMMNLHDPTLFGSDAAENEEPDVLMSYFVDKESFGPFYSPQRKLAFVRGRKGMGKSTLLAKAATEANKHEHVLVVTLRGSDLTSFGEFSSQDPSFLVNQWQQVICHAINVEIGSQMNVAISDNAMLMVEQAELIGFKNKNIIGSLLERFKIKAKFSAIEADILIGSSRKVNQLYQLRNHSNKAKEASVWVFVDDIDATFLNTHAMRLKVATFFFACRKLTTDVRGVFIRASVRTDVWSEVCRVDESLDKCEQFFVDVEWSEAEARFILAKKIYSYLVRNKLSMPEKSDPEQSPEPLLSMVLPRSVVWGDRHCPASHAIYVLSSSRPRWAGQLCRFSGEVAGQRRLLHITEACIWSAMPKFSRLRLDDLYREHEHQLPALRSFVEKFAGGKRRYSTMEIRAKVANTMLRDAAGMPIADLPLLHGQKITSELAVCRFFYQIGFIFGAGHATNSMVRFEHRPDLLVDENNLDDGMVWEIQGSYRYALNIK